MGSHPAVTLGATSEPNRRQQQQEVSQEDNIKNNK